MNTQGDELKVELPPAEVTIPEYKKKEHLTRMLVSCPDYKPGTSIMDSNGTEYEQTTAGLRRVSPKLSGKQLRKMRRATMVQTVETR